MTIRERRVVVVANPENRRVAFFQGALERAGFERATVVPWLDLAAGRTPLDEIVTEGTIVRFESPGENFLVERELIALGADLVESGAARLDATAARRLEEDRGRIFYPRQWYLGFRRVLRGCERALAAAPEHVCMNVPSEIAIMFDKRECQSRFAAAGIPVPFSVGGVASYDDLRARMRAVGRARVFVKLASGSSASGVVALETRGGRVQAHTTVELVRRPGAVHLYNSLAVRRYTDESSVAAIVDALCREGVQVEEWLPKAGIDGHAFDLRFVVVAGEARHVVVRMSRSPLTNLHLGNRRGDPEQVRELLGEERWDEARRSAASACSLFPRALYAGVDLLVGASLRRHAVLEINAFGDLLPNVVHDGLDTYAAEIAALPCAA